MPRSAAGRANARLAGEWNTLSEEGAERPSGPGRKSGEARLFALEALTGEAHVPSRLVSGIAELRPCHRRAVSCAVRSCWSAAIRHRKIDFADPGGCRARACRSPGSLYLRRRSGGSRFVCGAERLGSARCVLSQLAAETSVEDIIATSVGRKIPALIVIDSIQTMWTGMIRSCTGRRSRSKCGKRAGTDPLCEKTGAAVILVGHVTKDGQIAGPRVVEHMVDAVLSFEGEGSHQFRILRAVKNSVPDRLMKSGVLK